MRSLLRVASVLVVVASLDGCGGESGASDDPIGASRSAVVGTTYAGIFNNGNWVLDTVRNGTVDPGDRTGSFGLPGDLPFIVHRDPRINPAGNMVGVYRNGTWCFDWNNNISWDSPPDTCSTSFGLAGDRPVVGRWFAQCTSADCIGVFRNGTWILDTGNKAWDPALDVTVTYGTSTSLPVVGSWRFSAYTNIGYFKDGNWVLDTNGNMVEEASDKHGSFGLPGDYPISGDWDGDGIDNVGIFRPSNNNFCLDWNGNVAWDPSIDVCFAFGSGSGNLPVIGGVSSTPTTVYTAPQIIACRYSDDTRGTAADLPVLREEFTLAGQGRGAIYDYMKLVTAGKADWDNAQVYGWYTMNKTLSQVPGNFRATRIQWCLDAAQAAGLNLAASSRHVVIITDDYEDGASGTNALLNRLKWQGEADMTYMAHEILHQYDLQHSMSASGSHYQDPIDIMSAESFGGNSSVMFNSVFYGNSGPSLNSAYRYRFFSPIADDELVYWGANMTGTGNATVDVLALDHPEMAGTYLYRLVVPNSSNFYTVEYREKSGWDRNIPTSRVAVRLWDDAAKGTRFVADLTTTNPTYTQSSPALSVTVNSINATTHSANVTLNY